MYPLRRASAGALPVDAGLATGLDRLGVSAVPGAGPGATGAPRGRGRGGKGRVMAGEEEAWHYWPNFRRRCVEHRNSPVTDEEALDYVPQDAAAQIRYLFHRAGGKDIVGAITEVRRERMSDGGAR